MNLLCTDTSSVDKHSGNRRTKSLWDATNTKKVQCGPGTTEYFEFYVFHRDNDDEKGISLKVLL